MNKLHKILYRFVLMVILNATFTILADETPLADFQSRAAQTLRLHPFDVTHYQIALSLDERNQSFVGRTEVHFIATEADLQHVVLDAETFVVSAVHNSEQTPLIFTQANGSLDIRLAQPLDKGQNSKLIIQYQATNVDVDPTQFGMKAGYDLGLDFKAASATNPQLINTLSFPEGARHWFPCFDHPSDWATHDTIITVKQVYQATANGLLLSTTENLAEGTRTFHYRQTQPQPTYLYVLVAGPYSVLPATFGDVPLEYWVYPGKEADAAVTFAPTAKMISFFENLYGVKFPWAKYAQITVPGIGGGAESTSATVLGDSLVHNQQNLVDFPSNRVISHEIAHQWFGDFVGYQDWTHVWLSESFATLGEYLYQADDLGEDEGAWNLYNKKRDYLNEAHNKFMRAIVTNKWDRPDQMFDNHSYAKGAVILNMFRDMVGSSMFQRIMQQYLQRHAYSNATTRDFFAVVEEVSGEDYQWFFDQWLLKPGHPVLELSSNWDDKRKIVSLSIKQVQDTDKGTALFRLPIKVAFVTTKGKQVHSLWLSEKQQSYDFVLPAPPLLVRFDEGDVLLKEWTFSKTTSELLYQLRQDNAMGRLWAATELAARLSEPQVHLALQQTAETDVFWPVRQAALNALSSQPNASLLGWLQQRSSTDPKSQVRASAVRAMGSYRHPQFMAFIKQVYATDPSFLVQAAALDALSHYPDADLQAFFEKAALRTSPRNVLAKAANLALKDRPAINP
jgi:aminopeptidase N